MTFENDLEVLLTAPTGGCPPRQKNSFQLQHVNVQGEVKIDLPK